MNKYRRSQRNKIRNILEEKLSLEDSVAMWALDLQQIQRDAYKVKTIEYSDDVKNNGGSLEDRYIAKIDDRGALEDKIQDANDKIVKIETALKRLEIRNKESFEMFRMCYFERKSIGYICDVKQYSRGSVLNKIRDMEDTFMKLIIS